MVRGLGVGVSAYSAGTLGFDGLLVIKPDGRLAVQSGIGNLGTGSVFDVHRVAAEVLDIAWEKVDITWGNTSKYVPNTCGQGGSQTTHAMTRAAYAAANDAVDKLREIAAATLGGKPEDYRVANETVSGRGRSMTFAQAATKAIEFGGKFDGHELPKDINAFTTASATALAGRGVMGVAKDNYGRNGTSKSYVAGFAEVEVDVETGVSHSRLPGGRRRRYGAAPAESRRADSRRRDARHRARARPEVGVRHALRRAAGEALLSKQTADHPRRAGEDAMGGARYCGS
jgi:CO/xanthine dehydrogenase Mo-binding subunit